jgi:hypothetical protein
MTSRAPTVAKNAPLSGALMPLRIHSRNESRWWKTFSGVFSRATSFPRVARFPYSRSILAQHSFAPLRAEALTSVPPDLPGVVKSVRSFFGKPGSVGALAGLIFNSNPYKTHRDAEPRLTNSEAL